MFCITDFIFKTLMIPVNNFCKQKHAGKFSQRTAIYSGYDAIRLF